MKTCMNRMVALFSAGALALGLAASAVPANAASANKMLEIPVNYTNDNWDADWGSTSNSECSLWGLGEPSAFSESYTVSYKLYIPTTFIKEESAVNIMSGLSFNVVKDEEWPWAGSMELPVAEYHSDNTLTAWDQSTETDVPIDYATVKKAGDFYVISYEAQTKNYDSTDAETTATSSDNVALAFFTVVKGINISAAKSAIYLDDLKITKADGTVLINSNFNEKPEGNCFVAPNKAEKDAKDLNIATIKNNKVLSAPAKATVKVGKTVKLSPISSPSVKVTYASSNKKVATVNAKGVITGKKAGKAVITIKANTKTAKVNVTVK